MDLLALLFEDRPSMPGDLADDPLGRLRDLWRGGVALPRAAAACGLTPAEAERAPIALGFQVGPKPADADVDVLRRLYVEERLSAAKVAARLVLTVAAVRSRLRLAGVRRPPAVPAEQVRSLYEEGLSIRAVAAQLGVHQRDVWRHLDRAGVERRQRGKPGVVLARRPLEQLYLREGLTLAEIGRRFDVDPHVVARNLDRHGIPRRRAPLDRAVLEELYVEQRLGIRAVAERLGVTEAKVRADMAHHGIPVRRPGRPGPPGC